MARAFFRGFSKAQALKRERALKELERTQARYKELQILEKGMEIDRDNREESYAQNMAIFKDAHAKVLEMMEYKAADEVIPPVRMQIMTQSIQRAFNLGLNLEQADGDKRELLNIIPMGDGRYTADIRNTKRDGSSSEGAMTQEGEVFDGTNAVTFTLADVVDGFAEIETRFGTMRAMADTLQDRARMMERLLDPEGALGREFKTSEREAKQGYDTGEREAEQLWKDKDREDEQAHELGRDTRKRKQETSEREAGEEYEAGRDERKREHDERKWGRQDERQEDEQAHRREEGERRRKHETSERKEKAEAKVEKAAKPADRMKLVEAAGSDEFRAVLTAKDVPLDQQEAVVKAAQRGAADGQNPMDYVDDYIKEAADQAMPVDEGEGDDDESLWEQMKSWIGWDAGADEAQGAAPSTKRATFDPKMRKAMENIAKKNPLAAAILDLKGGR